MSQQSSNNNTAAAGGDLSKRDISKNPINFAIDTTDQFDFRPSKLDRLIQFAVDEIKRNFNIDPSGNRYHLAIVSSANNGDSYRVIADSTESQKYYGIELWSKNMVEKEVMSMKLDEKKLMEKARSQTHQHQEEDKEIK